MSIPFLLHYYRYMGVIPSWKINAARWIQAIEQNEIMSRQLATNQAIVDAIVSLQPTSVLDMGCGEGWLVRVLTTYCIKAAGVDAIQEFIQYATTKGSEQYFVASYEEILKGKLSGYQFDALVFNFSLFEQGLTEDLLAFAPQLLNHEGYIVIQTLHPINMPQTQPYVSHWEEDSWKGLCTGFDSPHRWYFRTLADWINLLTTSGFQLVQLTEPLHPETKRPISLILTGKKA
jgi:2-polyprenyl-3-methyl-5-hydroxy-6-metoxy-1,4-benzoquinol methylase